MFYFAGKLSCSEKNPRGEISANQNPVNVDFLTGATGYRVQSNILSEAVVKACISKQLPANQQTVLDCTGGFGQDAMMIARTGARVQILERNPIIGFLLADGLYRISLEDKFSVSLLFPASVIDSQVRELFTNFKFTTCYLDPMYPASKEKSAKVNKNMQFIQAIVGKDYDSDQLFQAARQVNCKRIVVKRPKNAPFIGNCPTSDKLETKGHRFDYYVNTKRES